MHLKKKLRWYWKPGWVFSWQVYETYIRWMCLYRAIINSGETVDFYLSTTRNARAAKRFLGKALRTIKSYNHPSTVNADKGKAYIPAIRTFKEEGVSPPNIHHLQVKCLNKSSRVRPWKAKAIAHRGQRSSE